MRLLALRPIFIHKHNATMISNFNFVESHYKLQDERSDPFIVSLNVSRWTELLPLVPFINSILFKLTHDVKVENLKLWTHSRIVVVFVLRLPCVIFAWSCWQYQSLYLQCVSQVVQIRCVRCKLYDFSCAYSISSSPSHHKIHKSLFVFKL